MAEARNLSSTVDAVVTALCADYERRKLAIRNHIHGFGVEMEYKYLNHKMLTAALEVVESEDAEIYIKEIGAHTGYARTEAAYCSEVIYKRRKQKIKQGIARRLRLWD